MLSALMTVEINFTIIPSVMNMEKKGNRPPKQLRQASSKRISQTRGLKDNDTLKSTDRSNHYQICIEGKLDERWLRWFEGLEAKMSSDNLTVMCAEFDQSALHGLFNRIRDLGVTLISVQRDSKKMNHHFDNT